MANLTNALQDSPGSDSYLRGWNSKYRNGPYGVQVDDQWAQLKKDIMGLSVRERKRIKAIAKDPPTPNLSQATTIATRQNLLPKIPIIPATNGISSSSIKTERSASKTDASSQNEDAIASKESEKEDTQKSKIQKPSKGKNIYDYNIKTFLSLTNIFYFFYFSVSFIGTQLYAQDIIHSYEAPLASDTYELPDNEALGVRMLGVSLEHGLIQGVDPVSVEIMLAGLEHYLKDLVQQAFERVKRRKVPAGHNEGASGSSVNGSSSNSRHSGSDISANGHHKVAPVNHHQEDVITVEDIARIMDSTPSCFVELNGPFYRLNDTLMMNDDEYVAVSKNAQETNDIDQLLDGIMSGGEAVTLG